MKAIAGSSSAITHGFKIYRYRAGASTPCAAAFRRLSSSEELWSWVPPEQAGQITPFSKRQGGYQIPIVEGVIPTPEEVEKYLIGQEGQDVKVLELQGGGLAEVSHFVLVTGRSLRHLNNMSAGLVQVLKKRRLKVQGSKGAEGGKNDDWQLVDCGRFFVHFLLQETRKAIDLEGHWSKEYRPFVPFEPNPIQYEKEFSKLLDKFPAPNDYVQVEGPKLKGDLDKLGLSKVKKL